MLVLNRKNGEEIRIGKDIVLKIISASDGNVKLGIEAPQQIAILRGELFENVRDSVIQASKESGKNIKQAQTLKINKIRE